MQTVRRPAPPRRTASTRRRREPAPVTAALRTGLTLAVLALLLVLAVTWGFHQATQPFPKKLETTACVDTDYAKGDSITPTKVTVNVLNASTRDGLAGRTMQLLTDQGFDAGATDDAPGGTTVAAAEIWTADRADPAVKLLRSYVGKVPVRTRTDLPYAGLDLVVGAQFGELAQGRASFTLRRDGTVCSPPVS